MKRILSAVLCLSMLIAAAPLSASAAMPYSGAKVIYNLYDVSSKWHPESNENQGMADAERKEDIRGITYEYTSEDGNGNWEYFSAGPEWSPSNGAVWAYRSGGKTSPTCRMRIQASKNKWVALKIKVPAAGRYHAELEYTTYTSSSATGEIYIVPSGTTDIGSALTAANKMGQVSYLDTSKEGWDVTTCALSDVEFQSAGEHYLIFKSLSSTGYMTPRKLTLDGTQGIYSVSVEAEDALLYLGESTSLDATAKYFDGTAVEGEYSLTYESSNPQVATVTSDGTVTSVGAGTTRITATASNSESSATGEIEIKVVIPKTEPTFYTAEKRQNAVSNAVTYSWAKSTTSTNTRLANAAITNLDAIYDSIAYEGIPRSSHMGLRNDPEYSKCPYCGIDVVAEYGSGTGGGWVVDVTAAPWKAQCPACKRFFPSNDFASLYRLGIGSDGHYDKALAKARNDEIVEDGGEGYLKNVLYPEAETLFGDANWSVDDGFGYEPLDENGKKIYRKNGVQVVYPFVALYNYFFWSDLQGYVTNLTNAYNYTGDIKYGRAGIILIDRIADVWPSFDASIYRGKYPLSDGSGGSGGLGLVQGSIQDASQAQIFASGCDSFFPARNDEQAIAYLSAKAQTQGLLNDKSTGNKIWKNIENGVLLQVWRGEKEGKINGNFGMKQLSLAIAAITLDREPETSEMIEWIYATDTGTAKNCTGGDLASTLIDVVDRDGMGDEAAPNYNNVWIQRLYQMADALAQYKGEREYDLYQNPKFVQMFMPNISVVLTDDHTAQIGDTPTTASIGITGASAQFISAFKRLKDTPYGTALASHIYRLNGFKTSGLHYDIYDPAPESIQQDIELMRDAQSLNMSEMLTGYGFAVLRDGEKTSSKNTLRDFWVYFGSNDGHGHNDTLNLGIESYGLNMAPDLGYPTTTGTDPNRQQWINHTLSHNTVTVNDKKMISARYPGFPKHFDDSGKVKLIDVEASGVYAETSKYRRTVIMVEANADVSYGVDFFNVEGGEKHTYSFHSQAENASAASGLSLVPQVNAAGDYIGTYAGAETTYGADPNSPASWSYETVYPRGYTWLTKVRRDESPESTFSVDFDVRDYNSALADGSGLHLRMTQINNFTPDEVAIVGGMVPVRPDTKKLPKTLDYVLVQREGENLKSFYTTVYEPYKNTRYISEISPVEVSVLSGTPAANDTVSAVKVLHTSGRCDYIVRAENKNVLYNIGGVFAFRGFAGVYTVNPDGSVDKYINDGDVIDGISENAAYTGTVTGFETSLTLENYIDVETDCENLSDLAGRFIYVDNESDEQNAAYKINSASRNGDGSVRLDIGTISLISGHIDKTDVSRGYVYNIAEGESFEIPATRTEENAFRLGDVDKNGSVNVSDSALLQRNLAGWSNCTVSPDAADVDFDGVISVRDDMILARHIANWQQFLLLPYIK